MVTRKRPTPDGRITSYSTPARPGRPAAQDPALRRLQPFIDACLAVIPEGMLSGPGRTGFVLFLVGAADRMWAHYGLDPHRFAAFASHLLEINGIRSGAAATVALNLPRLPEAGPARTALAEGAEVYAQWLEGHDPNAVLRLTELAPRWQRDGFDSGAGG